jgi:hypothetical protein
MTQPVRWLLTVLVAAANLFGASWPGAAWAQETEPPTVAFAQSAAVVTEGDGHVTIPVQLSVAWDRDVTADIALRGGTATLGEDVILLSEATRLSFAADAPGRRDIVFAVASDQQMEGLEFLDLAIQRSSVSVGARSTFRLWIRDDSLYTDAIADALIDHIRTDFAPAGLLPARAAADSLLGAVWNGDDTARGIFGWQQDRTDAKRTEETAREAGLSAEPAWHASRDDAEALRRDLHVLLPVHEDARSTLRSLWTTTPEEATLDAPSLSVRPALRGDVARAMLYAQAMYAERPSRVALRPLYPMLARWIDDDPVDLRELQRTTRVAQYQGQPNPFVVAPELIEAAFNLRGTYATPTVEFAASAGAVSEQDSVAVLNVVSSDVGDEDVTLTIALDPAASTIAPEDVDAFRMQAVTFPAGSPDGTTRRVQVPIVSDAIDEGTEQAVFVLRNASGFARVGDRVRYTLDVENARPPAERDERRFILGPAYPNPLSPGQGSTVRFEVSMDEPVPFTVEVFSTLGQRVRMKQYSAGEAERLDAIEINGRDLPSGLYILRLRGPSISTTETFVVVR